MEEQCEGVMYFKKLKVLDRSDHVPLVRKTGKKKVEGEKKDTNKTWYTGMGKDASDGVRFLKKKKGIGSYTGSLCVDGKG